eukprot:TRINITY_DN2088_c0_g1_i1.p1 TRINITY_DN2088_c0_g1~~TRINITY_DN2088_c0_g1_i1.p1  ORF type:complete len:275 (-),score=13.90 TRINITY_DN2088_c0_g1_i1:323-1090(-)
MGSESIDQLVARVLSKLHEKRPDLSKEEREFCDVGCLKRYLFTYKNDVDKAVARLLDTLKWREEFGVNQLNPHMFESDIPIGNLYIWNKLVDNKTVVIKRKRNDQNLNIDPEHYCVYLVFILETAIKMLPKDQEQIILMLDVTKYSRQNSPPFRSVIKMLRIVAWHYPQRLHKLYIVNAPTIFQALFAAISPFIDQIARRKLHFVRSDRYQQGKISQEEDSKDFLKYLEAFQTPFQEDQFRDMLQDMWVVSNEHN